MLKNVCRFLHEQQRCCMYCVIPMEATWRKRTFGVKLKWREKRKKRSRFAFQLQRFVKLI